LCNYSPEHHDGGGSVAAFATHQVLV
jgi:hypothetical protein